MSVDGEILTHRARTRRRRALDAATARIFKMPPGHHDYTLTPAVRVPMRDGAELLTDIYRPVGKSLGTLLIRTIYGRAGLITLLTARYYATHGYLVVNQSCRGTSGSGGDFEPFRPDIDQPAARVARLGHSERGGEQYERLRSRGVDVGLTIGPWTHVDVVTKGAGVVMEETLDWLAEHLAGTGRRLRPNPVHIFVTGANEWRWMPKWPPAPTEHVLYLQPDGELGDTQPTSTAGPSTFTYDPADPTPAVGGRVINPALGGYRDNRKLEERDDVLTFTGPPLNELLEVIGNPVLELVHRTDNPYADLFVRLCEVRKNGSSINVSDAFQRLEPEKSSGAILLRLEAMAHRFTPGTRIRLQISGGAHPRYARNLGTDKDQATSSELAPSRRTISHGDGGFSRILLPCQRVDERITAKY